MTTLDMLLCAALLGGSCVSIFALWAISRVNERVMAHARDVTKANLALSERPMAASLAAAMEESDGAHPQNGQLQEVGSRPNERRPW